MTCPPHDFSLRRPVVFGDPAYIRLVPMCVNCGIGDSEAFNAMKAADAKIADALDVPLDATEHWYYIEELELQTLLERVQAGEQPSIILAEMYANTDNVWNRDDK